MISKLGKSKLLRCPSGRILQSYRVNNITSSAASRDLSAKLISLAKVQTVKFRGPIFSFSNLITRSYGTSQEPLDKVKFESICAETLESLTDYFEELVETVPQFKNADVTYSDGVLTIHLGAYGTYVINRQSPNLQIWLSSPKSGPKRYDFVNGTWVYKHDKTSLHSLLDSEIKAIAEQEVEFTKKCAFSTAKDS